ncbi:MarR family transcriptional regulator [Novosphingobium sp. KCTC 2891]|uniref:MarR family winged helix-turn-helix transcriptional regulator n=1 Tax=Novosphingobium sp. KCTC 2891 TaxID=2989730 RepID=UPI002223C632|nr:helix-turn-helix domain-containing protein [Novosphingobium sp. KCTC 2891]MCW1383790.1 MarR family transcriptional regulator [Novosphingobium sp. KCTC 2891]
MKPAADLTDEDYVALSDFRHALRRFQAFSEARAVDVGLTPQQHQALLAIRGASEPEVTVGYLADRLILKQHSATGLVDRLEALQLVSRHEGVPDRRRSVLRLTDKAEALLASLSATHREEIGRLKPLLIEMLARLG